MARLIPCSHILPKTKAITTLFLFSLFFISGFSQDYGAHYHKSLKETLVKVENEFNIQLIISENLLKDKTVQYADWRFRNDVESTLNLILGIFDYVWYKKSDSVYQIESFRYSKKPVEEGKADLEKLISQCSTLKEWEIRKKELKNCISKTLHLSPLPSKPDSKPIILPERKFDGYTVQNISIETLPGLYVCGSVYKPLKYKGKIPVIMSPNGHGAEGRYNKDVQIRCAALAKMGSIVLNYDMLAYGESLLQFKPEDHKRSLTMSVQVLNSIRLLDFLFSVPGADTSRVGITGESGGGTQTMLVSALDERIKVSAPVVMTSAYFYGGCGCESGMPVHFCGNGTNNAEIAALSAPDPQLVISDGKDWTDHVPEIEFPYLKKIYSLYNNENQIENVHLVSEGHDFGPSKRLSIYRFFSRCFNLDIQKIENQNSNIDESFVTVEKPSEMKVFGDNGENLPPNALKGFRQLEVVFNKAANTPLNSGKYRISVCDWMILKRQKSGAFELAKKIGAEGLELDMGGLGNRPTFDNKLSEPSERKIFLDKSKETGIEISSIAMSGFYAQSFPTRDGIDKIIDDCINTMQLLNVKTAFLPLGVEGDLIKYPERRSAIVDRLKIAGKKAEAAGVVVGIETSLDAADEVKLLDEIGSPAIKIYFNFQNPLEAGRNLYSELKTLGADRICQIHCTDTDGVLLEYNQRIDLHKVKATLDEMGWSGWLVVERSRDANDVKNVESNYGANVRHLKNIFR